MPATTARLVLLLAGAVLVMAACGLDGGPTDSAGPSDGESGPPSAAPSQTVPGASGAPSSEPGPSEEPTGGPTPVPTASPSDGTSPSPAPDGSGADPSACSGSAENQDFFRTASGAIAWPVYCAVLPTGWFVDGGSYRLANGGRLEIAYRGPDGRRLELRQGAFCESGDGCVPGGTALGPAAYGDREGTLIGIDAESWAVVVDPGAPLAWQALGSGMTEDEMRALAAGLLRLAS